MSRLVRIVVAAAILFALSLPAMGHGIPHPHNCLSQHSWQSDGANVRHAAVRAWTNNPTGVYAIIVGQHFIAGDGLNKWVTAHQTYTSVCY